MLSAVGIAIAFGLPQEVVAALAPKSVTAAIAMGIAREIGGEPSLTATLVIATGILGAVLVTPLMNSGESSSSASLKRSDCLLRGGMHPRPRGK